MLQALYEATWGWKDRKKRDELKHDEARYFIASEQKSDSEGDHSCPVAFLHFRSN